MDRTVVIGVGNEMRSDDALGILVARELHRRLPSDVEISESNGEGGDLIERWAGADRALIIDAISAPGPAGSLVRFDASGASVPHNVLLGSSHSFGVAEAIEMARAIGRLPATVILYGIVGESFEMGTGLSDPVLKVFPELLRMITDEVVTVA